MSEYVYCKELQQVLQIPRSPSALIHLQIATDGARVIMEGDPPEVKRERKGYWWSGYASGPDTTMGVLWGTALVLVASKDATCHDFNGMGSGADGLSCSATTTWNETFFEEVGGVACIGKDLFNDDYYQHDRTNPNCSNAFATYRSMPAYTGDVAFTCNCSGPRSDHSFLGEGGARPSILFNLVVLLSMLLVYVVSPFVGTHSDFSHKKKRNWTVMCVIGGISNFGMMAIFPGGVWIVGVVFSSLTIVFTEIVVPIRSAYLEIIAKDDQTRGYLGAMRQYASYTAQLTFALVVGGTQLAFPAPEVWGLVAAAVCSVWFALSMPVVLKMMREHPAAREKPAGKTIFQLTISEMSRTLCNLKSYPEASKYLLATMLAQFGGPAMITYVSTYLPSQLLITSGIQVSAVALSVLVVGVGAARVLALLLQRAKISFRLVWVVVLTLNILIGALVPVLAREPTFTSYTYIYIYIYRCARSAPLGRRRAHAEGAGGADGALPSSCRPLCGSGRGVGLAWCGLCRRSAPPSLPQRHAGRAAGRLGNTCALATCLGHRYRRGRPTDARRGARRRAAHTHRALCGARERRPPAPQTRRAAATCCHWCRWRGRCTQRASQHGASSVVPDAHGRDPRAPRRAERPGCTRAPVERRQ